MRRIVGIAVLMVAALLAAAGFVREAQKRTAFVAGTDRYDNFDKARQLQRAVSDARAVAAAFRSLGFDVIAAENLTRGQFNSEWQRFLDQLKAGDTAAIYYAGHGVEIEGLNFLLPRDVPDVKFGRQEQIKREGISVAELLLDLRNRNPDVTLVILDACRDNPLIPDEGRSAGGGRGLAELRGRPSRGTFIIYSAGVGESALDRLPGNDPDGNSIFTRKLVPLLASLVCPCTTWRGSCVPMWWRWPRPFSTPRCRPTTTTCLANTAWRGARAGWEPTKPVQFIIPAGTGGGADQMARFIQGVVAKNNLMKQPLITVNKGGGAGAEGFLEVKKSAGDPHMIIITLSNLFTTPYATGVPFGWKDMTPVAMLALDQFVLWVNAETPYKTREGLHRRGEGRRRQDLQDGRHRLQAGGPDHHGGAGEADGAEEVHLRALRRRRRGGGAAGRQARQLDRQQSDRGGLAVEGRRAAAAVLFDGQAQRLHRIR